MKSAWMDNGKLVVLSEHATKRYVFYDFELGDIRAALSIPAPAPGLTADEAEVARIEAELAQFCIEREGYYTHTLDTAGFHRYRVRIGATDFEGAEKNQLKIIAKAIAYVRALLEPKPVLPEPEEMDETKKLLEFAQRGWALSTASEVITSSAKFTKMQPNGRPDVIVFGNKMTLTDALRRARELDNV